MVISLFRWLMPRWLISYRVKKLNTRGLMEPSCFKRATSRVKRWKGERLRHHRTSPVCLGNEERREIFTRLYRAGRGPMMIPRRERKLKVADRRPTDIEITSSIKVHSGLIFIVYGSRYGNFGFNIARETSSKRN